MSDEAVARFLTVEYSKRVDKRWRELTRPLAYFSVLLGRPVIVRRGFRSDGRSVPRWLWPAWALYGGVNSPAAWVHDWLYATGEVPQKTADAVFREALLVEGERPTAAAVMYLGVRIGGRWSYRRRPQSIPLPPRLEALTDPSPGA